LNFLTKNGKLILKIIIFSSKYYYMENSKKIGDIYNKKTTDDYYETVGKNADEKIKTDAERLFESLIPHDFQGKNVLDVGCGNGRHSEIFCERGANKVVAMDLSESMLEQAKVRKKEKQLNQLELVRADSDHLPVGKEKFDFIFSRFSLMYSGEIEEVVKNLSDSLSDGGEILVEVNIANMQDQKQQIDNKKKPIPLILAIDNKKVNLKNFAYSIEEYTDAFEKAGLRVKYVEQFPADELSIDKSFHAGENIEFSYGIFKLVKEKN
jgi:ubiquinone/menaquinone biosynthesis C-methylase UbiE